MPKAANTPNKTQPAKPRRPRTLMKRLATQEEYDLAKAASDLAIVMYSSPKCGACQEFEQDLARDWPTIRPAYPALRAFKAYCDDLPEVTAAIEYVPNIALWYRWQGTLEEVEMSNGYLDPKEIPARIAEIIKAVQEGNIADGDVDDDEPAPSE